MKTQSTPPALAATLLALTLASLPEAQAQLLTNESFNYTSGTSIAGQTGGTGWGGGWNVTNAANGYLYTTRTSPTLAYPGYSSTTTPAASGGTFLNLAAAFSGDNPNSATRLLDVSAGGAYGTNGYLSGGLIGADNKTLWGSFIYSNDTAAIGASAASFNLAGGTTTFSYTLPQASANNLIVYRINFGIGATDTVTLFSNPNLATFDGTTGGVTSAPGDYSFSAFRLVESYSGQSGGSNGSQTSIDDVRFGVTLASVAPAAVPEPSSYALTLLGAAATFAFGKRSGVFRAKKVA